MFAAKLLTHMMVACLGTQVRKAEISKCKLNASSVFLASMTVSERLPFLFHSVNNFGKCNNWRT